MAAPGPAPLRRDPRAPRHPLRAGGGRGRGQRGPRGAHERGGPPPGRRPPVPDLAGVPVQRRVPAAARPGHAAGRAHRAQRRVRDRHPGGPAAGGRVRRPLLARPDQGAGRRHPAPPGPAPGRAVHGAGRLGGGLAVRAAAAGPRPARGGHPGPADRHGRRRGRPVHDGLGPLLPAAPAPAVGDPDRRPHRLRPARRGHDRGRPRPQLGRLLVGVAPADGVRLRLRVLQRPRAVRAGGLLVQPVPRHLPPGDDRADPPGALRRPRGAGRGHAGAPGQRRPAGRAGGGRPGRPLRPDRGPGPGAGAGGRGAGGRARADPAPAGPGRRRGRGAGDPRRAPAAGARGRADQPGAAAGRAAGRPGRGRAAGVPVLDAGRGLAGGGRRRRAAGRRRRRPVRGLAEVAGAGRGDRGRRGAGWSCR